ncbi:MAG TPA: hypothetical protein VHS31_15665 [Tepidisphaeraceae bacterium]|jgi:hypothetical protein|nr:hypothetical protein [Tepidisphaeraceae bacterium]
MNNFKRLWILTAAVGAVSLLTTSTSLAQYRINTGGVLDANNKIGSSGANGGSDGTGNRTKYSGVTGNDIVLGNVTAGKGFRGAVPYGDNRAFRGNLSQSGTDRFVSESAGAPYGGMGGVMNSNANTVRSFYGDSKGVAPPEGYTTLNYGTPGYVPAPQDLRLGSDLRLGDIGATNNIALPQAGTTMMPGPVDASTNNTLITASSLYGVRQWNAGNANDQQFISRYANAFGENLNQPNSLSDLQVTAMQRELQQSASMTGQPIGTADTLAGQNANLNQTGTKTPSANPNLAQPLPPQLESPNNAALPSNQLQSSVPGTVLQGNLGTGESIRAHVLTLPAAQQGAANAALQARLDQEFGAKPQTDADAARKFNSDLKAMQEKNNAAGQGQGTGQQGAAGGNSPLVGPKDSTSNDKTAANKNAPVKIKDLSSGVKARGLSDILKKGEDLMKDGKWYSAVEQYDIARQVAPNNMLIIVGRANAELGGSYYGQAEADLRNAFTQDQAMLEGQFDLRSMIGEDRLQFLVKDLKDIAAKNPNQSRPVFLLAYIAYNAGNERMAAGYLDLAEKRANANDPFYSLVRKHWHLASEGQAPSPDMNK